MTRFSVVGMSCFLCILILNLLAGCAVTTSSSPGLPPAPTGAVPRAEVVTDSDETEAGRRTRLRMELATGYFEQGQTQVALDEIKRTLAIDPNNADAYNLRGLVYMRLEDYRQAEDSFRRALGINPRDAGTAHNLGWLMCQEKRFTDSITLFQQALSNPNYRDGPRTYLTLGLCQARSGDRASAERSLGRSYELDPGNPITGYNLARLTFDRKDFTRAQFLLRRLNNGEQANEETLWLGIKTEHNLRNFDAVSQLGGQLKKRFPSSRQATQFDRGAFDE